MSSAHREESIKVTAELIGAAKAYMLMKMVENNWHNCHYIPDLFDPFEMAVNWNIRAIANKTPGSDYKLPREICRCVLERLKPLLEKIGETKKQADIHERKSIRKRKLRYRRRRTR